MQAVTRAILLCLGMVMVGAVNANAVTGVNPSGVNVSHTSPSTIFLTFQNLAPGQTAVEAFWCGSVVTTAVSATDPCVPGTVFGRLPLRNNLGRASGTAGVNNFTDIMSIPASVSRRAYQDAQRGNDSRFFYVRRFANPSQFVVVTCRMAGGGARVPFALVDVKLKFNNEKPVFVVERGTPPPELVAEIRFTGTGRLKGRWEVVSPGDVEPTAFDLLPEASLPIEDRPLQRRYTILERFDIFLPPTGIATVPGPNVNNMPHQADGYYKLLFRVEATVDKESNSNAVTGTVAAGGAAGFPMPMMRYYVGNPKQARLNIDNPYLTSPVSRISAKNHLDFTWLVKPHAGYDKLEIESDGEVIFTAIVQSSLGRYRAPPWIKQQQGKALRWRITSLDHSGKKLGISPWQDFQISDHGIEEQGAGTAP